MVYESHGEFRRRCLYTENAAGACYRDRLGLVTAPRCKDPISSIVFTLSIVCSGDLKGYCPLLGHLSKQGEGGEGELFQNVLL